MDQDNNTQSDREELDRLMKAQVLDLISGAMLDLTDTLKEYDFVPPEALPLIYAAKEKIDQRSKELYDQ